MANWTTFLIMALFLAAMTLMGVYYSRRQTSTARYFVAESSIPGWAAGVSLFATLVSSVTFIAYPAAGYEGKWSLFAPGLMTPFVMILTVLVFIPIYRNVIKISAYEFMERRFDRGLRLYSAFAFSLNNFAKMGFVFYLVSLTITSVTGWDIYATLIVSGIITIFYTLIGGVEAVIWTEVIQGILLWAGGFIAIGFALLAAPGGPAAALDLAWTNSRFDFGGTEFDFSRATLWIVLTWGFVEAMQKYSADQVIVQRYIVSRSGREARKGVVWSVALSLLSGILFTLIGTSLWSYYQLSGEPLPTHFSKPEQVFPYFLSTQVPAAFGALVLAGMMAAAMSTVAAALNGLSSVFVEDFYGLLRPESSDRQRLWVGKLLVGVFGIFSVAIALVLIQTQETALALWYTIASIVSGGIVGLFLLAFLSARANRLGVYVGVSAGIVFTLWATLTMRVDKTFDLGFLDPPIHSYMIGVIANLIVGIVGYVASLLFAGRALDRRELTFWGWLEKRKAEAR